MPFAVLEERIRTLPEEYYQLVVDYIDTLTEKKTERRTSARGIASQFANPALIAKEKTAMKNTFDKKLNNRLV